MYLRTSNGSHAIPLHRVFKNTIELESHFFFSSTQIFILKNGLDWRSRLNNFVDQPSLLTQGKKQGQAGQIPSFHHLHKQPLTQRPRNMVESYLLLKIHPGVV